MKTAFWKTHANGIMLLLYGLLCILIRLWITAKGNINLSLQAGLALTTLYMSFFFFWGTSLRHRISRNGIRRKLLMIVALLMFWFFLRGMKYYVVAPETTASRYLWYLYYVPMLVIPLLYLFVAMSLGKTERYLLPKWTYGLMLLCALLLLLVLTNDWHELVFAFPKDLPIRSDVAYSYRAGYYLVAAWIALCATAAVIVVIVKCRLPDKGSRQIYPILCLAVGVIYEILFLNGVIGETVDIIVMYGFLVAVIIESCIRSGLIQSNTNYGQLFAGGTYGALITDRNQNVIHASETATIYDKETLYRAVDQTVYPQPDLQLHSAPIRGGYVYWNTDISQLNEVIRETEANEKELSERVHLQMESYQTKLHLESVKEKERLYSRLWDEARGQVDLMKELLDAYEQEADVQQKQKLLAKTIVVGTYMKRRGNLIFLAEKSDVVESRELELCLEESLSNLELLGCECGLEVQAGLKLKPQEAYAIYDLFEAVLEQAMEDLQSFWMQLSERKGRIRLHMEAETKVNLEQSLHTEFPGMKIAREDGIVTLGGALTPGGADGIEN